MTPTHDLFNSARWYDMGVNWQARLGREAPVFKDVFGPPGPLGLLDAACGTGRHVAALAREGYRMTGLDRSADMLTVAREHLDRSGVKATLIEASMEDIPPGVGPLDGVYCVGNSVAATGSPEAARRSVVSMARVLAPGGRLFVQILNFEKLRQQRPAIRGPRACRLGDVEYVSTRVFTFQGDFVEITNVTLWREDGWRQHAFCGRLYAVSSAELCAWSAEAGLIVDALYGNYDRVPFDAAASDDVILLARKPGPAA